MFAAILYQGHDEALGFVDQPKGKTMRNALFQIALLLAAFGLSGSLFSAALA